VKTFRSKEQRRRWERMEDRSTPEIRAILNEFERVRPYMGPTKLSGTNGPNLFVMVLMHSRGHGYFGVMSVTKEFIREEVTRKDAERELETVNACGSFI
jgi:hypothetical protein